jgi:aspartate aminotransferase
MTGWRGGWTMGPRPLIKACAALASHSTQSPATFAQVAAVTALTGPQRAVQEMAAAYRHRRDLVYGAIKALPRVTCVEPGGGFYVFPNVARHLTPELPTTIVMADRLLDEVGLGVIPGEAFGAPGYLRLSFARPTDELKEGVRRLAAFIGERSVP